MNNEKTLQELTEKVEDTSAESNLEDMDRGSYSLILQQERYAADTRHRLWLAWTIIGIIITWLVVVVIILMLNSKLFHLSDTVLITLLGTSTATVLGLPAIVLKGFFQFMNQTTDLNSFVKNRRNPQ